MEKGVSVSRLFASFHAYCARGFRKYPTNLHKPTNSSPQIGRRLVKAVSTARRQSKDEIRQYNYVKFNKARYLRIISHLTSRVNYWKPNLQSIVSSCKMFSLPFSVGEDELDLDDEVSLFYKSSIYPKKSRS